MLFIHSMTSSSSSNPPSSSYTLYASIQCPPFYKNNFSMWLSKTIIFLETMDHNMIDTLTDGPVSTMINTSTEIYILNWEWGTWCDKRDTNIIKLNGMVTWGGRNAVHVRYLDTQKNTKLIYYLLGYMITNIHNPDLCTPTTIVKNEYDLNNSQPRIVDWHYSNEKT